MNHLPQAREFTKLHHKLDREFTKLVKEHQQWVSRNMEEGDHKSLSMVESLSKERSDLTSHKAL